MKKVILLFSFVVILSNQVFAGSLVDSLADKVFNSIGGTALEQKAKEFETLLPKLEQWQQALEAIDTDKLGKDMFTATFKIYKDYGCPYIPSDLENMTYEELHKFSNDNADKLDEWVHSLPQETQDEMNKRAEEVIAIANPVMDIVKEGEPIINEMQTKITEIEPLLNNYIAGYGNFIKSYQDGTLDLSQYPEWQQALDLIKPMAEAYAKGDKITAFKYLDDITGIFSNSKAGQGLGILLKTADSVGLAKYFVKIVRGLLKFNGTENQLEGISDAQMEQAIQEYLDEVKSKAGIKSSDKYAGQIKGLVEDYIGKIDSAEKAKDILGKISNSPIGGLIKEQLENKSMDALGDFISKHSGVSKEQLKESGVLDIIEDTAKEVGEVGASGGSFIDVLKNVFNKVLKLIGI